jgi:hypothetical protein
LSSSLRGESRNILATTMRKGAEKDDQEKEKTYGGEE